MSLSLREFLNRKDDSRDMDILVKEVKEIIKNDPEAQIVSRVLFELKMFPHEFFNLSDSERALVVSMLNEKKEETKGE